MEQERTDPTGFPILRDASGAFVLDARRIAARFGWSEEEWHGMQRRGLVTSRVERGEDEDQGRWRLSVHCGNRRWFAIVTEEGAVIEEKLDFLPSPPRRDR
ncbi:conserved hypothetical protein [Hyphomicrobiales bacterium]|nr:conserved hypothetical protein [Hyphomicrobiales bacterium]CAH1698944.1 conserved hypothetical protein [Hyphomicrobiales bacterium]CAI0342589.1 conserved hypothetical protein [Hyphomicrobiales bacterium]